MPIAKNPNGARTDAERRAHNKWEQANRVTLGVRLSKDDGEAFRAWCADRGQTVNAALSAYVADCLRAGADGGAAPAAEIVQATQLPELLDGGALELARSAAAASGESLPDFLARAVRETAQTDANRRKLPPRGASANFPPVPDSGAESADSPDKGQFDFQARIDKLRQIHASRQQPEPPEVDAAETDSETEKI